MFPSLYHAHHQKHLEDLPFWLNLAAQAGDPVLELGCGTGRVLVPLAQAGYHTIGVDRDLSMLQFLQVHGGLQITPAPVLVSADISKFYLSMKFPLIILPCNTFSTLEGSNRKACLACVLQHLKSGGIFGVSIPNPNVLMDLPAESAPEFEELFIHPQTGNPVQVSSSWRRRDRTFILTWIYDQLIPDGTVNRITAKTIHHILPIDRYKDEFQLAGMKVIETYGGYDCSTYNAESPGLIFLATAKNN